MVKLPIPENSLDGTAYTTPTGEASSKPDYISPLAIPTAPQLSPEPTNESGPSTQPSQYEYPYKNYKKP